MAAVSLLVCLVAIGCGSYVSTAVRIRKEAASGNIPSALALLEEQAGDDPDVLNLVERGLLLFYAGRYEECNTLFQLADAKIEDLYTKSISREALAFLTNDATLPYTGYPHEQVLINVYLALSYMTLGDLESALVACRRVGLRLTQMADLRENTSGYTDDAFAEWLTGILYAEDGDGNSALVAARRAERAYDEYGELWGLPKPTQLVTDHILWGRRFGFLQEADELAESHPDAALRAEPRSREDGELLLVYESGTAPLLDEVRISFPILKSDTSDDLDHLADTMYTRGPRGEYVPAHGVKIDYWLDVALPVMVATTSTHRRARLLVDGEATETELVEDISALAKLTFDEEAGRRTIRTIARALAKYFAVKEVKKRDEFLGWVANITGSATERADTRSWTLLPDRIHMARLRLPAGTYRAVVEVLDDHGEVAQTATFAQVQVLPGELTVIHHRSYQ
jgi:hypothetical protein